MMKLLFPILALATGTLALSLPSKDQWKDADVDLKPRASCENTPTSRSCWGDYSIDTNYYVSFCSIFVVLRFSRYPILLVHSIKCCVFTHPMFPFSELMCGVVVHIWDKQYPSLASRHLEFKFKLHLYCFSCTRNIT